MQQSAQLWQREPVRSRRADLSALGYEDVSDMGGILDCPYAITAEGTGPAEWK